jgi:hypothetical protein
MGVLESEDSAFLVGDRMIDRRPILPSSLRNEYRQPAGYPLDPAPRRPIARQSPRRLRSISAAFSAWSPTARPCRRSAADATPLKLRLRPKRASSIAGRTWLGLVPLVLDHLAGSTVGLLSEASSSTSGQGSFEAVLPPP